MGNSRGISAVLDEIIAELILIDPENSDELTHLQELVDELEQALPEEQHGQLVEYFNRLSEEEPTHSIQEAIQSFQESVQSLLAYYDTEDSQTPPETTDSGPDSDDAEGMPEYLEDPGLLEDFLSEADEHLQSAEKYLLELEQDPENREHIDDIFRPFHTIKGIAGFLSLTDIQEIAHQYESYLDEARSGTLTVTPDAVDAILQTIDDIREIMAALGASLQQGHAVPHAVDVSEVVGRIAGFFSDQERQAEAGETSATSVTPETESSPVEDSEEPVVSLSPETEQEPTPAGTDALTGLEAEPMPAEEPADVPEAGDTPTGPPRSDASPPEVTESTPLADDSGDPSADAAPESESATPDPAEVEALQDPELLRDFLQESEEYLANVEQKLIEWENDPENLEIVNDIFRPFHIIKGVAGFLSLADIEAISHEYENLLDQAREGKLQLTSDITDLILSGVDALRKMMDALDASLEAGKWVPHNIKMEPHLQRIRALRSDGPEDVGPPAPVRMPEKQEAGTADAEPGQNAGKSEPAAQSPAAGQRRKPSMAIKVDIDKMDHLIDMVGELVIVQNMVSQNRLIRTATDKRLLADMAQLKRITSTLQNISMSLRMVPIQATFRKMQRIVRDLSHRSGKQIQLQLSGEQTEIDRNMVETLYDPLVHMIRNSCDHGIEMPEVRADAGKRREGTIHLNAYHRGGNVVIEISDDGAGLDKHAILEKARERGLVTEDQTLSDKQIYDLLFHPGFSTAKKVTEVSGRGVGMDVVKRTVEQMRGQIDIETEAGKGTTFFIRLPLTLAIIDGVIVRVGEERYVIPTLAIEESVQITEDRYNFLAGRGETVLVRDHIFPLIRLHHLFNVKKAEEEPWKGIVILVDLGGESAGILVDELIDKQEVVIKSMGEHFQSLPGISGGAILGDGSVGLILDVPNLLAVRDAKKREEEDPDQEKGQPHFAYSEV